MKGIILAGGSGTRLYPLTRSISKQILPIYDKPMIYYPMSVLMLAGIKDILIITTSRDIRVFQDLFGNGNSLGMNIEYSVQENPNGIVEAFLIGQKFIGNNSVSLILGDNIFFGQSFTILLKRLSELKKGAEIFGYSVKDPRSYGVVEFDKHMNVISIEVYGLLTREYIDSQELILDEKVRKIVEGRKNLKTYGDKFFTETTSLDPRSPYSASKASADIIVMAYHETYKLPVNITRCSNNYGPYQFPEKLIPLIIKNILSGKKLPVYGDGSNVRDWLYVKDHNKAVDMVINSGKVGEIYNIGGFNEEKNIDIVKLTIDTIRKIMEEEPSYRRILKTDINNISYDLIEYVQDRLGHDARYAIDPSKIAVELGWYPETTFTKGIEKTIRWYLDNQEWVNSL